MVSILICYPMVNHLDWIGTNMANELMAARLKSTLPVNPAN